MNDTRIKLLSTSGISSASPVLPDGIWLNLAEEPYFDQPRMGSTDISKLFLKQEGWWWQSSLNPRYVNERKKATDYGKALHKSVLEGVDAFKASIAVAPTKEALELQYGDRFCVTAGDMMAALEKRGMHPKGNTPKPELIKICQTRAPDLVIWDTELSKAEKAAEGKLLLSAEERWEIEFMTSIMHNHPDLEHLFAFSEENLPLPEVSVLFTDEHGLQRRVRYDELLPKTLIDLKAMTPYGNKKLEFATGEHVAEFAYHVQMADHMAVRHHWLPRMIREGKVYDGTPEDLQTKESTERFARQLAWLKRFPDEAVNSDYAWIFFQRPDSRKGAAPVVFPWGEDRGSDLHRRGIRCRRAAINLYRRCMEQFGPEEPWTRVEPLHSSDEQAVPRGMKKVFIPHWIGGDEPVPDEEDEV